jgi:hypothetical protein
MREEKFASAKCENLALNPKDLQISALQNV